MPAGPLPLGDDVTRSSPFLLTEQPPISATISALGVERAVVRGEYVYQQGALSAHFFELVSGRVRIFIPLPDGTERVLSMVEPGASFGESACFDGLPWYASAVAVAPSRVRVIGRDDVLREARNQPEVMLEIARRLARKQRLLSMHIAVAGMRARERVLLLLNYLLDAYASPTQDGAARFVVRHSVGELARMVGLTRVTMSRELSELIQRGLLAKDGRDIVVLDPDAVRVAARGYLI